MTKKTNSITVMQVFELLLSNKKKLMKAIVDGPDPIWYR
jgi:hypothetical protein